MLLVNNQDEGWNSEEDLVLLKEPVRIAGKVDDYLAIRALAGTNVDMFPEWPTRNHRICDGECEERD